MHIYTVGLIIVASYVACLGVVVAGARLKHGLKALERYIRVPFRDEADASIEDERGAPSKDGTTAKGKAGEHAHIKGVAVIGGVIACGLLVLLFLLPQYNRTAQSVYLHTAQPLYERVEQAVVAWGSVGDFKVTPRVSNVEQWADVLHLPVSPLEPSSTAFWCASNKCVQSTNTSAQPLPVHDKHATWSCNLMDAYGVTAGTLPHSISDLIDLRCCASRCASSTCDALDRASGFGSHVLECGACPTAMTSGCGPSVAGWDGTNHITNRAENDGIPPWAMSVCRAQIIHNATNAAHVRYFLAQQAAERFLLDSAEATLCTGIPTDGSTEADDAYHRRLHSLLAPYRMSTRMHISFAFLAKMTCVPTAYADRHRAMMNLNLKDQPLYMRGYFTSLGGSRSSSFGKTPSNGHIGADAAGFMPGTQIEWERLEKPWSRHSPAYVLEDAKGIPSAHDDWCILPILHHEPFNVKESWYVWNYTRDMLTAGASFCARPPEARRDQFAAWRVEQDAIGVWHKNNMAFAAYVTTYAPACARLAATLPGEPKAIDRLMDAKIAHEYDHLVRYMESIRKLGECSTAGVTADDLITALNADVNLMLVLARQCLDPYVADPTATNKNPRQRTPLCTWPAERIAALDAELGPLDPVAKERVAEQDSKFSFYAGPHEHWSVWAFSLAFAYHKLVPVCSKEDPTEFGGGGRLKTKPNWHCTITDQTSNGENRASGDFDGQVVYDLLPVDPLRGYCHGALCTQATNAIDLYRQLLHVITPFRTALIKGWIQWQCPYTSAIFEEQLKHIAKQLPKVIAALTAAKAGIVSTCVAPSRRLGSHMMKRSEDDVAHDGGVPDSNADAGVLGG